MFAYTLYMYIYTDFTEYLCVTHVQVAPISMSVFLCSFSPLVVRYDYLLCLCTCTIIFVVDIILVLFLLLCVFSNALSELFSEWTFRLSLMGTDFQHIDLVLSMRAACINSLLVNGRRPSLIIGNVQLYSEIYDILRTSAKLASEAGKYQVISVIIVSQYCVFHVCE